MKTYYYARVRRDHISWWAEVIDANSGRKIRSVSCLWKWSAKWAAKRQLRKALALKPVCERVA